jgi:hypothetical protein
MIVVREGRVLELYDQDNSTSEIEKELRMSLRDIGFILKKGQVNHGITATIMDNGNNNNSNNNKNQPANEKAIQAYKLFTEGKKPVDSCRCGYPIKPIRKGSNEILYGILETKGPIRIISYLPGIKGKSFLFSEAIQVSKKTWNNS